MNLMISIRGEPEQLPYLPEIVGLGAGIELGSYGLIGIRSEQDWNARLALHRALRAQFNGRLAIHGPFIGMEYAHIDHLIRATVRRRLDMTFEVARQLKANRVVLHANCKRETELFQLQEGWVKDAVAFWREEIGRWAAAGIEIVLENESETRPDVLVRLASEVNHPNLRLCLDVGHQHVFSDLGLVDWVRQMGPYLTHVHLHDNDRSGDRHWSIGRGTIQFEPFYAALEQSAPQATISLEVEDTMETRLRDLRELAVRFRSR